jgi:adenylate cyclase
VTEHRLAAILSADVAGYSRLMAEDEDATVRTLTVYREQIGALLREHRGRATDFSGDNFLAEFPTALSAVRCAMEIQRVLSARNASLPADRQMKFRIGAHLGDIRIEQDRIYGDGVNVAARLEGFAEPGGICISGAVHEQVASKLQLTCRDLGEQSLKNITRPVRVYRVPIDTTEAAENERASRPAQTNGAGQIRSLAVLPFESLSGDPDHEPFADGMTEALINDLAKIRSLRVASRTSILQYKGVRRPLPAVARELRVDGVIEGTVTREGDRMRVTAQLIDGRRDHHLWAESYERYIRGVLALQSEIARTIAQQIQLELAPEEEAALAGPLGRFFARVARVGLTED